MKVKEILEQFKLLSKSGQPINAHANDRDLLANNLGKDLLQYTMLGPNAIFAFKIRGNVALFELNITNCNTYGYKINRIQVWSNTVTEYYEKRRILLDKTFQQDFEDPYFKTWSTLGMISGGQR